MEASVPKDKPPDEADTVEIERRGAGPVIAVGTIQWSWALDDLGKHVDIKGNETRVDPRIQRLTYNMMRKLIAGAR